MFSVTNWLGVRQGLVALALCGAACIHTEPIPRAGERHISWETESGPVLATSSGAWARVGDSPSFMAWPADRYLVEPWSPAVHGQWPMLLQPGVGGGEELEGQFVDGTVEQLMPSSPPDGCFRLGWASFPDEAVLFCQRSKRVERAVVRVGESLEWSLLTELDPIEAEFQAAFSAQGDNRLLGVGPAGVFSVVDGENLVSPSRVSGASPGAVVRNDPFDSSRFAVARDEGSGGGHVVCTVEDWDVATASCESMGLEDGLSTLGFMRLDDGPSAVFLSGRVVRSPDYLWVNGALREIEIKGDESELTLLARVVMDVDGNGIDELLLLSRDGQPPRVFSFDGEQTFEERP